MKVFAVALIFAAAALPQTVQRYEYDPGGNRIAGPSTVATDGQRTERTRSINGRSVPLEKVEERVLRSDGTERVVERVVHRYNPEGQAVASLRFLVEEKKLPGGSSSIRTTVYENNAGGSRLVERSTAQVTKSGESATSETTVERPSYGGTLAVAERRTTVERKTDGSATSSTTILRPDTNGRFVEAVKETTARQGSGPQSVESAQRYEPDMFGRMQLIESTERTTVKRTDGSEAVTVDVYEPSTPGLANQNGRPKIKERQIIERRPAQGGVVETLAIRRPGLADPDRLGPPRTVSETVCTGKCQ